MKRLFWHIWSKHKYKRWLTLLKNSDFSITVQHTTRNEYFPSMYGPTALGEYIGTIDIYIVYLSIGTDNKYSWELDSHGKFLNKGIRKINNHLIDMSETIDILPEDYEWFELVSDSEFINAKLSK